MFLRNFGLTIALVLGLAAKASAIDFTIDPLWKVVANAPAGTFTQILWFKPTTGQAVIWTMDNNGQRINQVNIAEAPGWTPIGFADQDNDGIGDVFWRKNDGTTSVIWAMNYSGIKKSEAFVTNFPDGSFAAVSGGSRGANVFECKLTGACSSVRYLNSAIVPSPL